MSYDSIQYILIRILILSVYQLYHIIYGELVKEWNATKNINNILNMSFCSEITPQI